MPTSAIDLVPMLQREVNPPGAENFPDASAGQLMGYIADAFWDVRLAGIFSSYKIVLGQFLTPTLDENIPYITDADETGDFPEENWMMVIVFAGLRLIRLRILNLAINFRAKAGPVEFEQQASATTLRAVLDSLQRRVQELKLIYSDNVYAGAFILMDGVAQAAYAEAAGLSNYMVVR